MHVYIFLKTYQTKYQTFDFKIKNMSLYYYHLKYNQQKYHLNNFLIIFNEQKILLFTQKIYV